MWSHGADDPGVLRRVAGQSSLHDRYGHLDGVNSQLYAYLSTLDYDSTQTLGVKAWAIFL